MPCCSRSRYCFETEKSVVDIIRKEGTDDDITNYRNLLAVNNRLLVLRNNYEL